MYRLSYTIVGLSEPLRGAGGGQILVDQLTLSQPGVTDYAHHITTRPPKNLRPSYGPAIVYIDHMAHYLAECDHVWSFKISHFERYLCPLFSNQTLKI